MKDDIEQIYGHYFRVETVGWAEVKSYLWTVLEELTTQQLD